MRIFINGDKFLLNKTRLPLAWYPVFIDGVGYYIGNGDHDHLQSVAHSQAEELEIKFDHTVILPDEITILDRVWLLNAAGTYSRKLDPQEDMMNIFINGTEFKLTAREPLSARITKAAVIIEGTPYNVDDKALLEKVAPKKAHHLTFRWLDDKRPLPHRVTILDRVWQYDKNGTYGRKLDLHEDMMGFLINGTDFKLISIEPMGRYSPIIINGSHYDVDKGERLHAIAHSQAEELKITGVSFEQEITILDRVWSCKPGSSTYHPKVDIVFPSLPTLPFPHAGQVVSLDGVEVEVLHLDRGLVFWYNPVNEIHGMVKACKLKSSLVETMRADLAKGLEPKELIALGWSRKIS